jgi:hypothetical protein
MTKQASGAFKITSWEEQPYDEIEGQSKLTQATVGVTFAGGIEGAGTTVYLMNYREDESATYVFQQRVVGRIGEREGGFVLQGSGAFEDGVASGTWTVVPGSGTGALSNLRGEGGFTSGEERGGSYTLDYDLVDRSAD